MTTKEQSKQKLIEIIEKQLPDFVQAVKFGDGNEALIFHQHAFAADYQQEEFLLLGMAIKYAGIHGREIIIAATKE